MSGGNNCCKQSDVLLCHLKRVNYATAVIKKALYKHPKITSPDIYGWTIKDKVVSVQYETLSPIFSRVYVLWLQEEHVQKQPNVFAWCIN